MSAESRGAAPKGAGGGVMKATCPHCGRDLEGGELLTGLCTSEYCPRHDCPECEGMGFTYDDDGVLRYAEFGYPEFVALKEAQP